MTSFPKRGGWRQPIVVCNWSDDGSQPARWGVMLSGRRRMSERVSLYGNPRGKPEGANMREEASTLQEHTDPLSRGATAY